MTSEKTIEQLRNMRLWTIADEYDRQMNDPNTRQLSFDDRFGLMIDLEFARRGNNRLAKLIKLAGFTDRNACIENISYRPERRLDATLIQQLASCAYIERNLNVQLLGPTGAGKSFLANALGIAACRKGYSVKCAALQDILIELSMAKNNGTFNQVFSAYRKVRLLIADDWLMFDVTDDAEASFLYNLIEARKYSGSMIICSQIDAEGWHGRIANKVAADSICDRIVNSSHRIVVEGEMRKLLAQQTISAEA